MNRASIVNKTISKIITQLSSILFFEKKPITYSKKPITITIYVRAILNAVRNFTFCIHIISNIAASITIEFRVVLNVEYTDSSNPTSVFIANNITPMLIILFIYYKLIGGGIGENKVVKSGSSVILTQLAIP